MENIMIDLETLSTANNASILTIGAIKFNRNDFKITKKFYKRITKESNKQFNRDFNQDTIDWWNTQSEQAKSEIFENKDRINLNLGLQELSIFIGNSRAKIWANGVAFDINILESAYEACGLEVPWKFFNVRDVRTIYDLGDLNLNNFKRQNNLLNNCHNALADCETQLAAMEQAMDNIYDRCFVVE